MADVTSADPAGTEPESDPDSGGSAWRRDLRAVVGTLREKRALAGLVGIRILFAIVAGALIGPLSAWAVRMVVEGGGDFVVSNFDLANFFLSAEGLAFLTVTGTFALATLYFEQSGMVIVARSSLAGVRPPSLLAVLWAERLLFLRLLRLGLIQFAAYAAAAVPVLAVGGVCYLTLLGERDINYYLQVKPPQFWTAVGITSLAGVISLVAGLWIYLRWFLSVPILLFEGAGARASIRESRARTRGRAVRFGLEVLVITVAGAAVLFALGFLMDIPNRWALGRFGDSLPVVVGVVALMLAIDLIVVAVTAFLGFAGHCILVAWHYLDSGGVAPDPAGAGKEALLTGFLARRGAWSFVWGGAAVVLAITVFTGFALVDDAKTREITTEVTAHRGSSVLAPENTLSAIRLAIDDGADYAEIDVQVTADDEIVMIHDSELMRVAGLDLKVADLTRERRLTLDVGKWFSDDFAGEPLPTLDEVIATAKAGPIKLNIELKFGPTKRDTLVNGVAEIIHRTGFESQCVITSLDYAGLKAMKKQYPALDTGLIVSTAVGDVLRAEADFLSMNAAQIDRTFLAAAAGAGKDVHVWTVNEPVQMHAMIELGVANIITDVPKTLVEILKARAELSNTERLVLQIRSRLPDWSKAGMAPTGEL